MLRYVVVVLTLVGLLTVLGSAGAQDSNRTTTEQRERLAEVLSAAHADANRPGAGMSISPQRLAVFLVRYSSGSEHL